jgi:hypothetical protein
LDTFVDDSLSIRDLWGKRTGYLVCHWLFILSWSRCSGAGFQFVLCYPLCTVTFENIDEFISGFRSANDRISPVPPGVVIHEDGLREVAGAVTLPGLSISGESVVGYPVCGGGLGCG